MQYARLHNVQDILPGIRERAIRNDMTGDWPATDLQVLSRIGAMRWALPMSCGGEDYSPLELHLRYEAIASASLATALILSQRDSAAGLIESSDEFALRDELLQQMARGETFATVGIAQLTTSRQAGPPALTAKAVDNGWQLDGLIPWATGATHSQFVVAGAVTDDRRQILFALPTDLPGVTVEPPMQLVALRASHTGSVRCQNVRLEPRWIMRHPTESAHSARKKRGLPVPQAFLAMGHCQGAIDLILTHDSDRARAAADRLSGHLQRVREQVMAICAPNVTPDPREVARIRGEVNELTLRATHTAVTLFKGTALLPDHPAQRLAREAMFLLVWSCPDPVIDCTVELLSTTN